MSNSTTASFRNRREQRFALSTDAAEMLAAALATRVPRDPHYARMQPLRTMYVQPIEPGVESHDEAIRIRTYLAAPGQPTFLERKQWDGANRTKVRMQVEPSTGVRLLAGEDAAVVLDVAARSGTDRAIADHVVELLRTGWGPHVRTDYHRRAFESDDGSVRMTVDVMLSHAGYADLSSAGTRVRSEAVLECKTVDDAPKWLEELLDSAAAILIPLKRGKGATARRNLHRAIRDVSS